MESSSLSTSDLHVTVIDHPLVHHALSYLRAESSDAETFQRQARVAIQVLAVEMLRDLILVETPVQTPLETTTGYRLATSTIFVPVLRSGLAMLQAVTDFLPGSRVGFVGMERDEQTAIAHRYYNKLPTHLETSRVIILDPMLATGGSAHATATLLVERGARHLGLACIVAAPEGVRRLNADFPHMSIYACALDRQLDERKYILPGLGDFGDRYFGTAE